MKKISGEICGAGHVVDLVNYIKIIWFSLIVSLLGLDLPSPDYLQAETVNRKGILFYDDCEDAPNTTTDWGQSASGGGTLVTSTEGQGGQQLLQVRATPVQLQQNGAKT